MDAPGLVGRDLLHQVEYIVISGAETVPGIFGGRVLVLGQTGVPEKSTGLRIGLMGRDLVAKTDQSMRRGQPGEADSKNGDGGA